MVLLWPLRQLFKRALLPPLVRQGFLLRTLNEVLIKSMCMASIQFLYASKTKTWLFHMSMYPYGHVLLYVMMTRDFSFWIEAEIFGGKLLSPLTPLSAQHIYTINSASLAPLNPLHFPFPSFSSPAQPNPDLGVSASLRLNPHPPIVPSLLQWGRGGQGHRLSGDRLSASAGHLPSLPLSLSIALSQILTVRYRLHAPMRLPNLRISPKS